jgi:hypothetical protein
MPEMKNCGGRIKNINTGEVPAGCYSIRAHTK